MRIASLVAAGLITAFALPAMAQAPAATARVAGAVEKVDGNKVTVKGEQGPVTFDIRAESAIMVREPAKLSDIKSNTFLGTTAVEKDGKMVATEIHIFPESMRGAGEGHRPMQAPSTTMTNGNVTATMTNGAVSSIANGGTMKVAYKGGEKEVTVPANVEITVIKPLDISALKPGTKLTANLRQNADGSITGMIVTLVK
ncbi:MAG: hypothetical protein RLZZ403_281 [Pseudomonadota bacterium]|jgi:hypothetical protein